MVTQVLGGRGSFCVKARKINENKSTMEQEVKLLNQIYQTDFFSLLLVGSCAEEINYALFVDCYN